MFPVPSHLPRSTHEHISSDQPTQPDPVLDLLASVFEGNDSKGQGLSVDKVKNVRAKLESSVSDNKSRSHQLLRDNYPSVSSQIRLGDTLRGDFGRLQVTLLSLEKQIDSSDPETSFLPPVLSLLDRHFTAVQARTKAQTHISALQALSSISERIDRLEKAIWGGRGADEWVIKDLLEKGNVGEGEGDEVLRDVKVQNAAQQRLELFKSMVVEQVTDAFGKAVSFSNPDDGKHGISITVQNRTSLQQPRIPRPQDIGSPTKSSIPPPYALTYLYSTLSAFSSLSQTLSTLRTKILRDLLPPLVTGSWKVITSQAETLSILRLEKVDGKQSPKAVLNDVSTILSFIKQSIFPASPSLSSERSTFIQEVERSIFQSVLDNVILPAMPSSLSAIPTWLDLVHHAVSLEDDQNEGGETVIKPFFESEAGVAWATQRRRRIAEETRKLILGGWGGWEAKEAERQKDVIMVVEVEVEVDDVDMTDKTNNDDDGFGWGFDDEKASGSAPDKEDTGEKMEVDDGWGFQEEETRAGPSSPTKFSNTNDNDTPNEGDQSMGDGWDFEDIGATPAPEPSKQILAKPAREAKRLGKRVAKAKAVIDDDPWGSGSESIQSLVPPADVEGSNGTTEPEGWGWDDTPVEPSVPAPAPAPAPAPRVSEKSKRKELKEEKRTITETFLISRACDKLVDMAERVLREAKELGTELPSPSFASAIEVLFASATDVFDLHRSLLPSHYATQLRDVPTLAMQSHNDALHLASRVEALHTAHPSWYNADDLVKRLEALANYAYETQLAIQRDGIMEALDDADGFETIGTDIGLKKCERAVNGVVHNLESISRVLKVVLPMTTYLSVIGYLLDEAITRISGDVLSLLDITEGESNRLNDVLKSVRSLEEIFVVEPGQPSTVVAHAPHWLKFCYISELLQANLVDILYLFDSGALIDFTTSELVSLIRALFADSEKRDNAIEMIERGVPVAQGHAAV